MTVSTFQGLKKLAANSRVSVIGGGISGLSFAYFLGRLRPDVKITVYEKQARVGGYINTGHASAQTQQQTGCKSRRALKMERGPRTLRGVSPGTLIIVDLLQKMGRLDQLRGVHLGSKGNRKYLVKKQDGASAQVGEITGELIEVPGPGGRLSTMARFLASDLGKISIAGVLRDLFFRPKAGDAERLNNMSVEEFFTRHFGKPLITDIGSALTYGIYAADVADLNVGCVMPGMVQLERQDGSVVRAALKRLFQRSKTSSTPRLDADLQTYAARLGSDFDLQNLSRLLKRFPMLALTDGLSTLCEGLRGSMPANVEIATGAGVEQIRAAAAAGAANEPAGHAGGREIRLRLEDGREVVCEHVRSTAGAGVLAGILGDAGAEQAISGRLREFEYSSVTVCNVLIPRRHVKQYEGFGFLVPKARFSKEARVMGVIFDSDVEEHSGVFFPAGERSVAPVLRSRAGTPAGLSAEETGAAIQAVEREIVEREHAAPAGAEDEEFTKVTFMLNIARRNGVEPTLSKLRRIVEETFANLLGGPAALPAGWALERTTLWESIPLYDVAGEGFPARRRAVEDSVAARFGGRLSLGGMTFARGIGVPDAVVSSLRAAAELAGADSQHTTESR